MGDIEISAEDQSALEALVAQPRAENRLVQRAGIVLLAADDVGTNDISNTVGVTTAPCASGRTCGARRAFEACPTRSVVGALLHQRQLKFGVHTSVADLEQAIQEYLDAHNADPKPFVWTKDADQILDKISRLCRKSPRPKRRNLGWSGTGGSC